MIKIERPKLGDETRHWGPPFVGDQSTYFLSVNRNKRSIAIDIKQPAGLEVVRRLVGNADVFIENFLPGTLDKAGLGWGELSVLNPGLVYASITGYGATGPCKTIVLSSTLLTHSVHSPTCPRPTYVPPPPPCPSAARPTAARPPGSPSTRTPVHA